MNYHVAIVGPDLVGWLDRWRGDMFVDVYPQIPRLMVRPGQKLIAAMQDPGRLVAVIEATDGGSYMLPFNAVDLDGLPKPGTEPRYECPLPHAVRGFSGPRVKPVEPPKSKDARDVETMRTIQRLAGETLTIMSHPGGFFEGVQKRVLELNRARRWKMLARKLRAENRRLRRLVGEK